MTAQRICFTIPPCPFFVFVAFVTCDIHYDARLIELSQSFQDMNGAHDVCRVCLDGILVPSSHNGLRGHVYDHVGLAASQCRFDLWKIPDVTLDRPNKMGYSCLSE